MMVNDSLLGMSYVYVFLGNYQNAQPNWHEKQALELKRKSPAKGILHKSCDSKAQNSAEGGCDEQTSDPLRPLLFVSEALRPKGEVNHDKHLEKSCEAPAQGKQLVVIRVCQQK